MKNQGYFKIILILVSIMITKVSLSQGAWKYYTKEDGLASNTITNVFEDKQKNIWFITSMNGIVKFDGNNWVNYSKKEGLVLNSIAAFFEDTNGFIWLGFFREGFKGNGLMKFNGFSFDLISKKGANFIYEDSKGKIWFGPVVINSYDGGLYTYDGKIVKTYSKKNRELASNVITSFFYDKTGVIWIGTLKGVSKLDGDKWKIFGDGSGGPTSRVNCITTDNHGNLWFGTKDGVYCYDGSNWMHYTMSDGLVSDNIIKLKVDTKGNVWSISGKVTKRADLLSIGTTLLSKSGLNVFDHEKWRTFDKGPDIPNSLVTEVFIQKNGRMWFKTYISGFHMYDGHSWTSFKKSEGFRSNNFSAILEDSRGNLWLGLVGAGIGKFDGQEWTFYNEDTGFPIKGVLSITEDSQGNIWFGTYRGVAKYTP